jgi:hypothetical protein
MRDVVSVRSTWRAEQLQNKSTCYAFQDHSGTVALRQQTTLTEFSGMAQLHRSLIAALPVFSGLGSVALDDILTDARPMRAKKGVNLFD